MIVESVTKVSFDERGEFQKVFFPVVLTFCLDIETGSLRFSDFVMPWTHSLYGEINKIPTANTIFTCISITFDDD